MTVTVHAAGNYLVSASASLDESNAGRNDVAKCFLALPTLGTGVIRTNTFDETGSLSGFLTVSVVGSVNITASSAVIELECEGPDTISSVPGTTTDPNVSIPNGSTIYAVSIGNLVVNP